MKPLHDPSPAGFSTPSQPASRPDLASILVINEREDFCRLVTRYLTALGYFVRTVQDGRVGLTEVVAGRWQAVILGTETSEDDWAEVLRTVRRTSDVPILLVGVDVVAGLEAGADGCLPKNCSVRQLLAYLHAVTRRAAMTADALRQKSTPEEFVIADLRIVPDVRRVTLAGRELSLTPSQFALLLSLVVAHGRVKSRDDLYAEISSKSYNAFDRSIDVQMSCLRRKLGDDPKQPRFIRTVRSAGYMLVHPDAS